MIVLYLFIAALVVFALIQAAEMFIDAESAARWIGRRDGR